jgi:hypothetical protein
LGKIINDSSRIETECRRAQLERNFHGTSSCIRCTESKFLLAGPCTVLCNIHNGSRCLRALLNFVWHSPFSGSASGFSAFGSSAPGFSSFDCSTAFVLYFLGSAAGSSAFGLSVSVLLPSALFHFLQPNKLAD